MSFFNWLQSKLGFSTFLTVLVIIIAGLVLLYCGLKFYESWYNRRIDHRKNRRHR